MFFLCLVIAHSAFSYARDLVLSFRLYLEFVMGPGTLKTVTRAKIPPRRAGGTSCRPTQVPDRAELHTVVAETTPLHVSPLLGLTVRPETPLLAT